MPKVSVIMSVCNEKETYLLDAINSILNQTFKDFEFIIIDDGSEESVRAVLNTFTDDRIRLITNEENTGLTASLNKGLFWASGEYIARQDADDVSEPTRFQAQVTYLDEHPEIGVIGTSTTIINESGDEIDKWDADPNPMVSLKTGNRLTHGSVMFRRTVMEEIGKYDYHFKYAQDYEYWLRISKKYQIRNILDRLYKSRVHKNMIGQAKAEEQALYVILAQRKADGSDSLNPLEYSELRREEKIKYHNMVIYSYLQGNDISRAKKEITNLFKIDPLNLQNLVLGTAVLLGGKDGVKKTLNIYRKLRKQKAKL